MRKKFWDSGKYEVQNTMLENMIERNNSTKEYKRLPWNYYCRHNGTTIMVCQKFICNVFGIGAKRIKTVQKKIKSGETMEDKRGRHMNQKVKLTDDLKTLIQVHCKSIPHSESHYSRENSKLNYFYDISLTLSELYLLFLDFYTAVTRNESIPIDKTTY